MSSSIHVTLSILLGITIITIDSETEKCMGRTNVIDKSGDRTIDMILSQVLSIRSDIDCRTRINKVVWPEMLTKMTEKDNHRQIVAETCSLACPCNLKTGRVSTHNEK